MEMDLDGLGNSIPSQAKEALMPEENVRVAKLSDLAMLCAMLLAVLLFVGAAIVAMYFAAQWLGLQAAIAWAAFLGLAILLIRIEHQRKQEQERVLADRKREQYFELLEVLRKCFFGQDPVQSARRQKQELDRWSLRLALIGSDEVLRAWHNFCQVALGVSEYDLEEDEEEDEEDEDDELADFEDSLYTAQVRLLAALRRDCGHPRTRLTRWEVAELLEATE